MERFCRKKTSSKCEKTLEKQRNCNSAIEKWLALWYAVARNIGVDGVKASFVRFREGRKAESGLWKGGAGSSLPSRAGEACSVAGA